MTSAGWWSGSAAANRRAPSGARPSRLQQLGAVAVLEQVPVGLASAPNSWRVEPTSSGTSAPGTGPQAFGHRPCVQLAVHDRAERQPAADRAHHRQEVVGRSARPAAGSRRPARRSAPLSVTLAKPARSGVTPEPGGEVGRGALRGGQRDVGRDAGHATRRRRTARGPGACVSSVITAPPPADCPAIVTRGGSPPNAAMLSRTHSSASSQSRTPRLTGASGSQPKPVEAQPVGDRHGHDAVAVERGAVVPGAGRGPRDVPAAVDVDQHGQRRRRPRRGGRA